jgi:hypothetical protein
MAGQLASEEDEEAGELDQTEEVLCVELPADDPGYDASETARRSADLTSSDMVRP